METYTTSFETYDKNGRITGYVELVRPILTDEERARRMKRIEEAAAKLLLDKYRRGR